MGVGAYYNEIEPYAAQWLRNLIKAGHIADGDVDERSIVEVKASDLKKYSQCHFFAGVGVWSYALRRAGWKDDERVWTGSCPCQPFSVAGTKGGFGDGRHLWPVWFELIKKCRPGVVFGEQVASKDALTWIDVVQADLEAEDYAIGTVDLCAAGFGAPHLRQRFYWVADSKSSGWGEECQELRRNTERDQTQGRCSGPVSGSASGELGDTDSKRSQVRSRDTVGRRALRLQGSAAAETGIVGGNWTDADLVWCQDGKYRPVEPGTFPLAHGITNRVGRLRATGNALVAPVAEEFVKSYMSIQTRRESSVRILLHWFQWNDPNGEYDTEGVSEEEAWEMLLDIVSSNE